MLINPIDTRNMSFNISVISRLIIRDKSIKMFDIYCKHYGLTTAEEIARCWNGGPRGMDKDATVYYWKKVQDHLDS